MTREELGKYAHYNYMMNVANRGFRPCSVVAVDSPMPEGTLMSLRHADGSVEYATSMTDLLSALRDGDSLKAEKDIDMGAQLVKLGNDYSFSIDLNGHVLATKAGNDKGILVCSPDGESGHRNSNITVSNGTLSAVGESSSEVEAIVINPRKMLPRGNVPGTTTPGRKTYRYEKLSFVTDYGELVFGANEGVDCTISECNVAARQIRLANSHGPAYNGDVWQNSLRIIASEMSADTYWVGASKSMAIDSGTFSPLHSDKMTFSLNTSQDQCPHSDISVLGGTFSGKVVLEDMMALVNVHNARIVDGEVFAYTDVHIGGGKFEGGMEITYPTQTNPTGHMDKVEEKKPLVHFSGNVKFKKDIEGGEEFDPTTSLIDTGLADIVGPYRFQLDGEGYWVLNKR